jgi:hypothetical protein
VGSWNHGDPNGDRVLHHSCICIPDHYLHWEKNSEQVIQNVNCHSFTRRNFSLVFSVFTPATVVRMTRTLWHIGASSEIWRRVIRYYGKNISQELAASNFRLEIYATILFFNLEDDDIIFLRNAATDQPKHLRSHPNTPWVLEYSLGLWDVLLERRLLELERRWANSALSAAIWQERSAIRCRSAVLLGRSRAATPVICAGAELSVVCVVLRRGHKRGIVWNWGRWLRVLGRRS